MLRISKHLPALSPLSENATSTAVWSTSVSPLANRVVSSPPIPQLSLIEEEEFIDPVFSPSS